MLNLQKGYSHETFKYGNTHVFKYTEDPKRFGFVERQYEWLKKAQDIIPQHAFTYLKKVNDGKVCGYIMERITPQELQVSDIGSIFKAIWELTHTEVTVPKNMHELQTYQKYVTEVVSKNIDDFKFIDVYLFDQEFYKYYELAKIQRSYCHGDMTIDNILKAENGQVIFIDPNYRLDLWQSHYLDVAKLYQETCFNFPELYTEIRDYASKNRYDLQFLDLLHITHYIRMIPYVKTRPEVYAEKLEKLQILYDRYFS